MPGNHTKRGEYFRDIHRAMRSCLKELSVEFEYWRDYYRTMYDWYPEFRKDVKALEEVDESAAKAYLNNLSYGGLLKIDLNELEEWYKGTGLPLKKMGAHNTPILIKNNEKNIKLASEYLKQNFYKRFRHSLTCDKTKHMTCDMGEKGSECIVKAAFGVIEKYNRSHAEFIDQFTKDHQMDYFAQWAMVIIYAQSNELPYVRKEELVEPPNIFMASKGEIQRLSPLENRCAGASRLLIINYAGTAFLAAERITSEVKNAWSVFLHNLLSGGTDVDIVLTDPNTPAAHDAERYKMRPQTLKVPLNQIISENIHDLENTMEKYTDSDICLYLTDIALPCAYLKAEFEEEYWRDNIKIDLYLPSFAEYKPNAVPEDECDDRLRQSFVIFRKSNPDLYEVFSKNMERILEHSVKYQRSGKNDY